MQADARFVFYRVERLAEARAAYRRDAVHLAGPLRYVASEVHLHLAAKVGKDEHADAHVVADAERLEPLAVPPEPPLVARQHPLAALAIASSSPEACRYEGANPVEEWTDVL